MEKKMMARPADKSSSRVLRLAVLGMTVLCLAGLIVGLQPSTDTGETRLRALEQILLAEGFSNLRVDENVGRTMIYGLVPTKVDANTVRRIAAGQSYPVQVIVRDQEEFSRAILGVLAGHGLFPQVRIENGEAVLLGYILDSLTENAALSWARGAAPRVAPIRSALLTRDAVEKTLTAELHKAGLTEKFAVDWRPGVIALNGSIVDKNALAAVLEAVRDALDSPIAFQLATAPEQERIYVGKVPGGIGQDALPNKNHVQEGQSNPFGERLSLRSITPASGGASLPFITTSDGAVYFLGGTLPSGYTLMGISTDRLEFSRNGSSMAYKLQGR
jgi:type III secretion system YscD/HrpQ family protein